MSTTAATISIRHQAVDEVLDFLRRRTMGPDVADGPIAFAGLIVEALDCREELAYTRQFMLERNLTSPEEQKLAPYGIDLYSLNVAVHLTAQYGSLFYHNAHVVAEIFCTELTRHFRTQADVYVQENYAYCLYDSGTLVARLDLPEYIYRVWPNALTIQAKL